MVVPPLNQEVFAWLGGRGAAPAGAPFWKYNVIDMAENSRSKRACRSPRPWQAMTGWCPACSRPGATPRSPTWVIPASSLAATGALLDWAAGQGLTFDMSPGDNGERWACLLEIYLTDPSQEPDMSKWVTELAFKLAVTRGSYRGCRPASGRRSLLIGPRRPARRVRAPWHRPTCRRGSAVVINDHKSGPDNLCWPTISADFRGAGCRRSQRTSANLVAAVVESAAADTEHIHYGTRCDR